MALRFVLAESHGAEGGRCPPGLAAAVVVVVSNTRTSITTTTIWLLIGNRATATWPNQTHTHTTHDRIESFRIKYAALASCLFLRSLSLYPLVLILLLQSFISTNFHSTAIDRIDVIQQKKKKNWKKKKKKFTAHNNRIESRMSVQYTDAIMAMLLRVQPSMHCNVTLFTCIYVWFCLGDSRYL